MGLSLSTNPASGQRQIEASSAPSDTQMDRFVLHLRKGLREEINRARQEFEDGMTTHITRAVASNAASVMALAQAHSGLVAAFHSVLEHVNSIESATGQATAAATTNAKHTLDGLRALDTKVEGLEARVAAIDLSIEGLRKDTANQMGTAAHLESVLTAQLHEVETALAQTVLASVATLTAELTEFRNRPVLPTIWAEFKSKFRRSPP